MSIANSSDHRRVCTANLLHTKQLPNPLGRKAYQVRRVRSIRIRYRTAGVADLCLDTSSSSQVFNLRWCRPRDLFGLQIPVTTGRFELRICCIGSRYLTHFGNYLGNYFIWKRFAVQALLWSRYHRRLKPGQKLKCLNINQLLCRKVANSGTPNPRNLLSFMAQWVR